MDTMCRCVSPLLVEFYPRVSETGWDGTGEW